MEQPLWVWSKTIAPSGMFIYAGEKFPQWRGSVFTGAMVNGHLNRLLLRENAVVLEERLLLGKVRRVRLVAQDGQGLIYLGTDAGELLRIVPAAMAK
jgi:glucose/arabinose dehydrogenase